MPIRAPVINPYAKQSRINGVRKGGGEREHGGSRKGTNSSRHGRKKMKVSSEKLTIKKNGTRNTRHGYLMHAFGRYGIVADIGREEGEDKKNYISG